MQVNWNYQSQSNDVQSLSWAYKLDENFYSTGTSATVVSGSSSVSGTSWLSGVSYGSHTLYVALLDQPGGNLLSTDIHSFCYQSGDSGTQSGSDGTVHYIFEDPSNPSCKLTSELNSSVNLEMIWVEPGTFMMGYDFSGPWYGSPQHHVTLTKGYYLGQFELTQAQYEAVMTGNDENLSSTPSYHGGYPNRPVEMVSYDDLTVFFKRLNSKEADNIPEGWAYTFPTEAQWEYACRAGTTTLYSWGDNISSINANYNSNDTVNVGSYSENPWAFLTCTAM